MERRQRINIGVRRNRSRIVEPMPEGAPPHSSQVQIVDADTIGRLERGEPLPPSKNGLSDMSGRAYSTEPSLLLDGVSTALADLTLDPSDVAEPCKRTPVDPETRAYFGESHSYSNSLQISAHLRKIELGIAHYPVSIISAPTGSGKTTQIPQYVAECCVKAGYDFRGVVTQPRRIAATSVARRVCEERGWDMGSFCGYQIALDRTAVNENTKLVYVTTGVLLQRLINEKSLARYTHIFIDEVHERTEETDLLLMMIREFCRVEKFSIKVIVMSATFEIDKFANYFANEGGVFKYQIDPPTERSIEISYLEDLRQFTIFPPSFINDRMFHKIEPQLIDASVECAASIIKTLDQIDSEENGRRLGVLVFLPGFEEINIMRKKLEPYRENHKWRIHPLHSTITVQEQNRVFEASLPQERKIILSTNIAESSITVPDIDYVIDFCLQKSLLLDPSTRFPKLSLEWASQASCDQRAGRTGRVRPGIVFRMVPFRFFAELQKYQTPEIERSPLTLSVLRVKKVVTDSPICGSPRDLLLKCPSPPDVAEVTQCVKELKQLGALTVTMMDNSFKTDDGELTRLGDFMSYLPIDIRLSKLIFLGNIFGVLDDALIIAACLSLQNMFLTPFLQRMDAFLSRLAWSDQSMSDLMAFLNAFKLLKRLEEGGYLTDVNERARNSRAAWCRANFIEEKRIREVNNLAEEIKHRIRQAGIDIDLKARNMESDPLEDQLILRIVFCGAFYPNYFLRENLDGQRIARELSDYDPHSSVWLKGFPQNEGFLYTQQLKRALEFISTSITVDTQSTQAVISFDAENPRLKDFRRNQLFHEKEKASAAATADGGGPVNEAEDKPVIQESLVQTTVYMAVKMRQLDERIKMKRLSRERAEELISDLNSFQHLKAELIKNFTGQPFINNALLHTERYIVPPYSQSFPLDVVKLPKSNQFEVQVISIVGSAHFWLNIISEEMFNAVDLLDTASRALIRKIESPLTSGAFKFDSSRGRPIYSGSFVVIETDWLEGIEFARAYVTRRDELANITDFWLVDIGVKCSVPGKTARIYSIAENIHLIREDTQILPLLTVPALGRECVLYGLKPKSDQSPDGAWDSEAIKTFMDEWSDAQERGATFRLKVYSVVNNVIRGDLIWKETGDDGEETSLRRLLITRGFAEPTLESYSSQMDHKRRFILSDRDAIKPPPKPIDWTPCDMPDPFTPETDTLVSHDTGLAIPAPAQSSASVLVASKDWLEDNLDQIRSHDEFELQGPYSPLECRFVGVSRATSERNVRVEVDSVNSVFLEWDYTSINSRMIVAASASVSQHESANVIARATTVMPNIPGMPIIMCMLFAPEMELRLNESQDTYIGALFGLGAAPNGKAFHAEQDIELPFNVTIYHEDIADSNKVRSMMNDFMQGLAHGGIETVRYRLALREIVKKLLFRVRSRAIPFKRSHIVPYRWTPASERVHDVSVRQNGDNKSSVPLFSNIIYRAHKFKEINDSYWRQLLSKNIIHLENCVAQNRIPPANNRATCLMCGSVTFWTVRDLCNHLNSDEHVERLKEFLRVVEYHKEIGELNLMEVLEREGLH